MTSTIRTTNPKLQPSVVTVTPADFDITAASDEDLDNYGIPRRPDPQRAPETFAAWRHISGQASVSLNLSFELP
jgi:hypothetical protein